MSDFYDITAGISGRYQVNKKLGVAGEVRYATSIHPNDPLRDANSLFLLIGGDYPFSRRINANVRFGTQTRTFEDSGISRTGPFMETSLVWRYHRAGALTWTTRLGYEEPPGPSLSIQVLRTSINIAQSFSARLKATGGLSAAHSITSDDTTDVSSNSNILGIDAGMEYMLTRNMTLTGTYTFTGLLSSLPNSDYFRNQIFFGVRYSF